MEQGQERRNSIFEYDRRLSHVETIVAGLSTAMSSLRADIEKVARSIEKLSEKQSVGTPWGVLASWAGVIITIMMLIGSGYVRDINRIERTAIEWDTRIQKDINIVDVTLQREMQLREEYIKTRFKDLEERLRSLENK